jgi:hypothetical protein
VKAAPKKKATTTKAAATTKPKATKKKPLASIDENISDSFIEHDTDDAGSGSEGNPKAMKVGDSAPSRAKKSASDTYQKVSAIALTRLKGGSTTSILSFSSSVNWSIS